MLGMLPQRYEPDGTVAEGGYGSVIFCEDVHLSRKVAIKSILDRRQQRRIMDEVKALLKLRSKHVVQVYDLIVSPVGDLGIVQEFVDGEDLVDSTLPTRSARDYLMTIWQVASGISDIHEAGLIHRDIKPNNIKISSEAVVKIFDFGLARENGPAAQTVGFVGTRGFAAPELCTGGAFTEAVDVFAFGATALHIGIRDLPNGMWNVPPILEVQNPFDRLPFEIAAELRWLMWQCIAAVPRDRPSMSVVKDMIGRYLLFNRHQALVIHKNTASYLNAANPVVFLEYGKVGSVEIQYDGLKFFVSEVTGEVFVNNVAATVGLQIPNSCVIALGDNARRTNERVFITFDVSNPEIVL